jgi:hypothetical protein
MAQIKLILCFSNNPCRYKRIKLHAPTALPRRLPRCFDCTRDWAFLTVCLETLVTNIKNLSSFGNKTSIDLDVNNIIILKCKGNVIFKTCLNTSQRLGYSNGEISCGGLHSVGSG